MVWTFASKRKYLTDRACQWFIYECNVSVKGWSSNQVFQYYLFLKKSTNKTFCVTTAFVSRSSLDCAYTDEMFITALCKKSTLNVTQNSSSAILITTQGVFQTVPSFTALVVTDRRYANTDNCANYGTWKFITAFTTARHLSLSWAKRNQSTTSHPISSRFITMLSSHLRLDLPCGLFPTGS
jgi:hypothetical protein